MRRIGRGVFGLFDGSDLFYPEILEGTEALRISMDEDSRSLTCPDDAFCLNMHQGYDFLFFRCLEGDDPPIYHYLEHSGVIEKEENSLSGLMYGI